MEFNQSNQAINRRFDQSINQSIECYQQHTYLQNLSRASVENSDQLILAGGDDLAALVVERRWEYHIGMALDYAQRLGRADVPNDDLTVRACKKIFNKKKRSPSSSQRVLNSPQIRLRKSFSTTKKSQNCKNPHQGIKRRKKIPTDAHQDVVGGGVPLNGLHAALVVFEGDDRLRHVDKESAVGDLPYFDGAVVGRTGDDVVVKRAPLNVRHGALVTGDDRRVLVLTSHLIWWHGVKFPHKMKEKRPIFSDNEPENLLLFKMEKISAMEKNLRKYAVPHFDRLIDWLQYDALEFNVYWLNWVTKNN